MTCPICEKPLVWVDNGHRLQYYYCRHCKEELVELQKAAKRRKSIDQDDTDLFPYGPDWYFPKFL